MKTDNQNDCLLWLQLKQGNKNAFAQIYKAHIASLISYGAKLCADKEILKDNIQDLFIELWDSRENLAQPESVKFYLFKALRYKLIRAEKLSQLNTHSSLSSDESDYNRFELSAETELINKEIIDSRASSLRKAITTLTKRQQEAVQLRFYQGFSNDQIAELMQMNYQSVSNLLHTALYRIKNNLKSSPVFTTALLAAFHIFF
ncbi:MAG TPA: sigma-70 family RNA polymerase sigma factor [Puia sp.]|nr:sigma-70 family RNA polymerase sigma factor [Puia sp.]